MYYGSIKLDEKKGGKAGRKKFLVQSFSKGSNLLGGNIIKIFDILYILKLWNLTNVSRNYVF